VPFLTISTGYVGATPLVRIRKIPASMLPKLSQVFAVSLETLLGIPQKPAKRGPASKLQRQVEQISQLPRAKQKFVTEILDTVLQQAG